MLRRAWIAFALLAACNGSVEDTSRAPATAGDAGTVTDPSPVDAGAEAEAPLRNVTETKAVDLGTVTAGQTVTLDVPAGALGFVVVVQGASASDPVGIEEITSPSGEVVHAAYTPKGGSHATSQSAFGAIAAAAVPQSEAKSATPPEPGAWRIKLGDGAGGTTTVMHAEARIQMGSANGFVGGRLDLNVYVPDGLDLGGARLDATKAKDSEEVERRLDVFFQSLFDLYAIDRGKVTFLPAAADLRQITTDTQLLDAFSASSGTNDGQALDVVLTNAIDFGGGNAAWGIAPGIPGAATKAGTVLSGIVLAVGDTPAIGDGLTLLHEAGHFFGLNHTTELEGGFADPLSDTPKCDGITLSDPSSLGKCPDKKNIMFPTFYGTAGALVQASDAQRSVVRGTAAYRAYADGVLGQGTRDRRTWGVGGIAPARLSLTKSGRDLNPTEIYLAATLCPATKSDPKAFVAARGQAAIAELRAAANDPDLPSVVRRKAAGILSALGQP